MALDNLKRQGKSAAVGLLGKNLRGLLETQVILFVVTSQGLIHLNQHQSIVVNKEQILDSPPDVIFVTSFENQFEILEELWPTLSQKGVKLVFYSGNDYWPDAYPWYMLSNYLCADQLALNLCQQHNKHFLYY